MMEGTGNIHKRRIIFHYNVDSPVLMRESQHVLVRAKLHARYIPFRGMSHIWIYLNVASGSDDILAKDVAHSSQSDAQLARLGECHVTRRGEKAELAKFFHRPQVPNADYAVDAAGGEVIPARSDGDGFYAATIRQDRREVFGGGRRPERNNT